MPSNSVAATSSIDGQYKVSGKLWTVGHKYVLHDHVGGGSYGDVCKATDLETNQMVALKRVANFLCCPLLAKRVLREVCIMRRLSHPHVISLTDVFTYPSMEVEGALDLYIATEFAERGDLYHLKEPVSASDVKLLLWQLLTAVHYLHSCHVWHRDIKSENILLTSRLHVKVCDFGLSRSAEEAALGFEAPQVSVNAKSLPIKKVLTRQYTKMVVTPSYRAPEVIMSRGQYNSTIDIWSIGCIFWELLVRSMNPQNCGTLANPLFGVRGEPATPEAGSKYAKDACSPLAEQLDVIFNVVGTPCWKDIESIPSESWRAYLKGLPGRAGNLARNLIGLVDDDAIDLIARMLSFDPTRRCTAEEALSHAYFKSIKKAAESKPPFAENLSSAISSGSLWKIKDPSMALAQLERELEASEKDPDGGKIKLIMLLGREIQQQHYQNLMRRSFLCSLAAAKLQLLHQTDTLALAPQSMLVNTQAETLVLAPQSMLVNTQSLSFVPQSYFASASQNKGVYSNVDAQETSPCHCVSCNKKSKENHRTKNGVLKRAKNVAESQESLQGNLVLENHLGGQGSNPNAQPKRARTAQKLQNDSNALQKNHKGSVPESMNSVNLDFVKMPVITNGKPPEIMFFPRRSPRVQDHAKSFPAPKKAYLQAIK